MASARSGPEIANKTQASRMYSTMFAQHDLQTLGCKNEGRPRAGFVNLGCPEFRN